MPFFGMTVNQDVVKVRRVEKSVEVLSQCVVDESIKCGRGACQPEWHNKLLEGFETGAESRQVFLTRFDADIVERRNDVDLRKELHSLQAVQSLQSKCNG